MPAVRRPVAGRHVTWEVAMTSTSIRTENDQGQATPLLIGVIAMMVVLVFAVAHLGRTVADSARARAAADAAALSGVVDGDAAARSIAAKNGAVVTSIERIGSDLVVEVRVGSSLARARATLNGDRATTLGSRGLDRPPR